MANKGEQKKSIRAKAVELLQTNQEYYPDDAVRTAVDDAIAEVEAKEELIDSVTRPGGGLMWKAEPSEHKPYIWEHIDSDLEAMRRRKDEGFSKYSLEELIAMKHSGRKFPVLPLDDRTDDEDIFNRSVDEELEDYDDGYDIGDLHDLDYDGIWGDDDESY
jgi:hypothetical protein